MITNLARGGLISILLHTASAGYDRCGATAKGGVGKWPTTFNRNLNTFRVDQSNGMEEAVLKCSYECCNNYDSINYPCDLAFLDFLPTENSLSWLSNSDPQFAICQHFSCYDIYGNFNCLFENEPYMLDESGRQVFTKASWLYAFSDDLMPLLDNDGAKVREALKLQGNITSENGKQVGIIMKEEVSKSPRSLDTIGELEAMEKGAMAQSKIDKLANKTQMLKIVTPLLIVAMVLAMGIATVTLKYKRLKKTIKYDGVKDADYYTKLDPADMAAEQEAQALINGAYDI